MCGLHGPLKAVMKKHITYILRSLLLLAAVLCVSATAWSQGITQEATCGDETASAAPVMLKAPSLRQIHLNGDVNCNGEVDINDVTALINTILSGTPVPNGDVNNNGEVDINDVTLLISMILSGVPKYDVAAGIEALNDIYRSMRTAGWSTTGNTHQAFGISAYTLMAEVMGDDFAMSAQGNGWFWFDAGYNVKSRYNSTAWRSYDLWNAYYTWIANANYILAAAQTMTGATSDVNYIKGQAYAIRAYSYFMLVQSFARTYKGHETEPGVPLFTGTYFVGSTGQSRATVSQVYAQIDADIAQAITLLNGTTQQVPDHIGYAVALGLKTRIALVKEDWSTALASARNAINASGKTIQEVSAFEGLNDVSKGNVMWGADIPDDQVGMYASFWAHMDPNGAYYIRAPKQITPWLFNKMSATDARRAWWSSNSSNNTGGYDTQKFRVTEGTEWGGDYIYMRVEEMYLSVAEAACRLGISSMAKDYLNSVMAKRDPNYTCNKTGTALGALTTDETGSLLEEILIQRRIELWGEDGRIMTIRRLRQGFERTAENGWISALLLSGQVVSDPESYAWVLTIPQSEFTGNANMNPEFIPVGDQNPMGDVTGVGQNVSFETASSSMTTARTDFYYEVTLTRATTHGRYVTSVSLVNPVNGLSVSGNVTFPDGSNTAKAQVYCYPLTLGQTYRGTLTLSPYDVTCNTGGSQITTHAFTIHCQNGNPAGQKISFEQASLVDDSEGSNYWAPVKLTRDRTDNEYSATLIFSTDNPSVVTISSQNVFFAEGASTATTMVYFNNMEIGHSYGCTLSLSPEDVATGGEITSMQITVTRSNWVNIGTATFVSEWYDETVHPTIKQIEGTNTYKMINPFLNGYDIVFTIENNKVYIQPQPCYYLGGNYGEVSMMGYANEDNSGYAGTYDPNTKTANLSIRYYCDAGYWPTSNDVLTMP